MRMISLKCILDFDNDNFIGKEDLMETVNALTRSDLNDEEVDFICDRVSKLAT